MKSLSNYIAESLNRGSIVYSLEDINSVLLQHKDLENEWEEWLQELNTKLTELANNNIGNTPKSLVTRWKVFQSNIYRFGVDKYSKIQGLISKISDGKATTELQDAIDALNNDIFKYFLSELRALVKVKKEVSVNGRISNKNYLIVLHELFEKPFIVNGSEVMEMESETDTIMKLAVVCCGDVKLIDEYVSKYGDPLK